MILVVDIGNTRLRWGLWRGGRLVPGGALGAGDVDAAALAAAWAQLPRPRQVVVCTVAPPPLAAVAAEASRRRWGLEPVWLRVGPGCAGVSNAYARPERLGADRWAALLAARVRAPQGAVVVDCGSAITVDGLDAAGRHLGGVILPGLGRMYRLLTEEIGLEALPLAEAEPRVPVCDTAPAVANGVLCAALGGLERATAAILRQLGPGAARLITGGDAEVLARHLGGGWQVIPDLVLEGVARWALAGCGEPAC